MPSFQERNEVPIMGKYEVVVIGGGVAGVGAALAASRNGANTLLIEKGVLLGGLATLGNIGAYLPLCDGRGRKVIGGISEELLHQSIKYGYDSLSSEWEMGKETVIDADSRYATIFSPPAFALALDELLQSAGTDLLFDTLFSSPVLEGESCKGVIVENKSGRVAYESEVVVDASGDADVMERAGAECVTSDNWLSYCIYLTSLDRIGRALEREDLGKAISLVCLGGNRDGEGVPQGAREYGGTEGEEVSQFILKGREMLRNRIAAKGDEELPVNLPAMAQLRTTRRIKSYRDLQEEDVFRGFEDSIGCAGDFRQAGPVYEIPYRSLLSPSLKNVITAGRTIGAAGDTWEVTRVIPVAALTGQAAGTAAALAVEDEVALKNVPRQTLQKALADTGVIIHI